MGIAFVVFIAACSSRAPKRAPELGNCMPSSDVTCSPPSAGGGGVGETNNSEASTPTGDDGGRTDATTCGGAESAVSPNDPACQACVDANCCPQAKACIGDCQALVMCTPLCGPGDQGCIAGCVSFSMTGLTAYQNLAACLLTPCPQCPVLRK
jgi:hypothetical protein